MRESRTYGSVRGACDETHVPTATVNAALFDDARADALWPFRRKLAEQFYGRFFELAPDTRRLFPDDMERQQLKLMDTIAAIVGTLDQRELFQSIISHTGRKHADFGVQTSHFTAFGEALIWGLQQQFGPAFTPEMQQAWIVLYDAIQAEMMRATKSKSEDSRTDKVIE
jgi:hemoglobin-like flavoprotein